MYSVWNSLNVTQVPEKDDKKKIPKSCFNKDVDTCTTCKQSKEPPICIYNFTVKGAAEVRVGFDPACHFDSIKYIIIFIVNKYKFLILSD